MVGGSLLLLVAVIAVFRFWLELEWPLAGAELHQIVLLGIVASAGFVAYSMVGCPTGTWTFDERGIRYSRPSGFESELKWTEVVRVEITRWTVLLVGTNGRNMTVPRSALRRTGLAALLVVFGHHGGLSIVDVRKAVFVDRHAAWTYVARLAAFAAAIVLVLTATILFASRSFWGGQP